MLTKKDLSLIEKIIDQKLEEKLEEKFTEKLKYLLTKDEFYEKMDEVMGELKAIREEKAAFSLTISRHSDTLDNHEKRIKKLEVAPLSA